MPFLYLYIHVFINTRNFNNSILAKEYSSSSSLKDIFGNQVKEYIIGNSVMSIGDYAFYKCSSLTSVTIGNSVRRISSSAFSGCSGLTSITINSDYVLSKAYSSSSSLKYIFGNQVKEFIIGNSVTSIGSNAFYDCFDLTAVTIPNSVTSIGSYTFLGCI